MNELISSISIEALLSRRNAAAERVRGMLKAHLEIQELLEPIEHSSLGTTLYMSDRRAFDDADDAEHMIKGIDARMWDHLLKLSGLWQLMDATARQEWRSNIDNHDVPELTAENIAATFEALHGGRGLMFERGVLAVFRSLSWDYKTNLPVRFGKRLVITRVVDNGGKGGWKYARPSFGGTNGLDDLIRVMVTLDGRPEPANGSWRTLDALGWPRSQALAELHGMFTVRGFKNGNAHLTFTRLDLVDRMNLILAKQHPNDLPPAREAA